MKLFDLLESNFDVPDDAKPHTSYNASGTIKLSQYSNDFMPPPGFIDIGTLVHKAEQHLDNARVSSIPISDRLRATQYWIDRSDIGAGDPVFPDLEDEYSAPVVVLYNNLYHIIDGHHRMDNAIKQNRSRISVWLIKLS